MPKPERSSPQPQANAFAPSFLERFTQLDEPYTASEAEFGGPWRRQSQGETVGLLRAWEDDRLGDEPYARFSDDQTALLAAAVLPARGQLGTYRVARERSGDGFRVERHGRCVGCVRMFDEHFVEALSLAEALVRCPRSLALLLRAAGPTALEQIGRILSRELEERE